MGILLVYDVTDERSFSSMFSMFPDSCARHERGAVETEKGPP